MKNEVPILEMKNISKRFGGTVALDNVFLSLNRGEVLGLVGENGAGKSTLMKILCGVFTRDTGEVFINGKETNIENVKQARELGISIIYQELSLVPDLSVAENIFLNRELTNGKKGLLASRIKIKEMKRISKKILKDNLSVDINVNRKIADLRLCEQQSVEIARSLSSNADIIIMDEPTAALEKEERIHLFETIANLKKTGCAIIFVSHHLEEILEICDNVAVIRDGKNVANLPVKDLDVESVISHMIGNSLENQYPKIEVEQGETILEVKNLSNGRYYEDISFSVKEGEVLGIAGLAGCGKNEVIRTIFGLYKDYEGSINIRGKKIKPKRVSNSIKTGIAMVPAERKTEGIFSSKNINWNFSIANLDSYRSSLLNVSGIAKEADKYIEELSIKTDSGKRIISELSGGNQQKVMLSRWIQLDPDLFLLEEPTRGIDIYAKTEVYRLMMDLVKRKKGIIMVSSEAPELLGICDRIIVMFEGKISSILTRAEATEEKLAYYSVSLEGE